jgi:cell division protein FtsB
MPRLTLRLPKPGPAPDTDGDGDRASTDAVPPPGQPTPAAAAALGTLSDLPVAGLTRRRIALLIGALVAAWVIVLFARQVGEASEASTRAEVMRAANERLEGDVAALERELELIQRQAYVEQQAREYRLGEAREIPFVLDADAPPLAVDAPGTASVRLGAGRQRITPLEAWVDLLFGPGGDPARPTGTPDEGDTAGGEGGDPAN